MCLENASLTHTDTPTLDLNLPNRSVWDAEAAGEGASIYFDLC